MIFDIFLASYFAFKFLKRGTNSEKSRTIIFARGAFRRDIKDLTDAAETIVINGELIRRIIRQAVPDAWLEQVIALGYSAEIRARFPLTLKLFRSFVNQRPTRIVYGGVDYFEVALFANRDLYSKETVIDAIFHENYAIDYVANLNMALYQGVSSKFIFDNVFTYGPPATRILRTYTLNQAGPSPMVMPRLARMENDREFFERLGKLNNASFATTLTLLAFPGTEYLAPVCFTATLLQLAKLREQNNVEGIVKFKSKKSAVPYLRQCGALSSRLKWKFDGSIEELAWTSGFTIVFNSISLYEALLGPTIVLIPHYLDTLHDPNLLQESPSSIAKMDSVLFVNSPDELGPLMAQYDTARIKALVAAERQARKAVVAKKFYLSASSTTLPTTNAVI
jgi:hypothetical protein